MAGRPTVTAPEADATPENTEAEANTVPPVEKTASEELDAISPPVVTLNAVPAPGTKCVKFEGGTVGSRGSSYEITATQFREVNVAQGFTNPEQTEVSFNKLNGHLVPAEVFTKEGLARLIKETDLSLYTVPDPEADKTDSE